MEQYIPKSVLVAEIEKLMNYYDSEYDEDSTEVKAAKGNVCHEILCTIDSLEVKEVQEEPYVMSKAERYIDKHTRSDSNHLVSVAEKGLDRVISYHKWITPDNALEAVRIARKELLENAIKWLRKELVNFEDYNGMGEELYLDFKQAMEKGEEV